MDKKLFLFTRYFIISNSKSACKVSCTFDGITFDTCDVLNLRLPCNRVATVISHEELQKFVAKASQIIYSVFGNPHKANYDLIKYFIELAQMFENDI